jgi:hypothetical protein
MLQAMIIALCFFAASNNALPLKRGTTLLGKRFLTFAGRPSILGLLISLPPESAQDMQMALGFRGHLFTPFKDSCNGQQQDQQHNGNGGSMATFIRLRR